MDGVNFMVPMAKHLALLQALDTRTTEESSSTEGPRAMLHFQKRFLRIFAPDGVVFTHFHEPNNTTLAPTTQIENVYGDYVQGDKNIQIELIRREYPIESFRTELESREQRLFSEWQEASHTERAILELEVADLQRKYDSLEQSYKEKVNLLADLNLFLSAHRPHVPNIEYQDALEALSNGNTDKAYQLFENAERNMLGEVQHSAEAAFQQGRIAEDRFDFRRAYRHYQRAAQLRPNNSTYVHLAEQFGIRISLAEKGKNIQYLREPQTDGNTTSTARIGIDSDQHAAPSQLDMQGDHKPTMPLSESYSYKENSAAPSGPSGIITPSLAEGVLGSDFTLNIHREGTAASKLYCYTDFEVDLDGNWTANSMYSNGQEWESIRFYSLLTVKSIDGREVISIPQNHHLKGSHGGRAREERTVASGKLPEKVVRYISKDNATYSCRKVSDWNAENLQKVVEIAAWVSAL